MVVGEERNQPRQTVTEKAGTEEQRPRHIAVAEVGKVRKYAGSRTRRAYGYV